MNIESIKETLRQRAQSLNVTPITVAVPAQEQVASANTIRPRQNAQPAQTESPATVIPLSTPQVPTPVPTQAVEAVQQKPALKAPVRNSRAKAKAAPLTDIEAIVAEHLRVGVDYNVIPGFATRKPALLKSGAEVLCSVFGFTTQSEVINREMELKQGFALYEVKTTVLDSEGHIRATGLGSCNSQEKKFLKQGFAGSLNTILKMARKRSFVDAILSATAASRIFTQDIEELSAKSENLQDRRDA